MIRRNKSLGFFLGFQRDMVLTALIVSVGFGLLYGLVPALNYFFSLILIIQVAAAYIFRLELIAFIGKFFKTRL